MSHSSLRVAMMVVTSSGGRDPHGHDGEPDHDLRDAQAPGDVDRAAHQPVGAEHREPQAGGEHPRVPGTARGVAGVGKLRELSHLLRGRSEGEQVRLGFLAVERYDLAIFDDQF